MKPGVLQSVGGQRVRYNLMTEQKQEVGSLCPPDRNDLSLAPSSMCAVATWVPLYPSYGFLRLWPPGSGPGAGLQHRNTQAQVKNRTQQTCAHVGSRVHGYSCVHAWTHMERYTCMGACVHTQVCALSHKTITEHTLGFLALLQTAGHRELEFELRHSVMSGSGTPLDRSPPVSFMHWMS